MLKKPSKPGAPGPAPRDAQRVLVIKLGALGDFIQSLASARAIRDYHLGARITLLTTEPFRKFAEKCPYFDLVEADGRPNDLEGTAQLISRIRAAKYDMVYDLQTSGRTGRYFLGLQPRPPLWCGIAPGCSHPHLNPDRETMHTLDRLADQIAVAGIGPPEGYPLGEAPRPDLSWVRPALRNPPSLKPAFFGIKGRYVLIIPGASEHRPEKRWPQDHFVELARRIAAGGVTPVVIGANAEKEVGAAVARAEPAAKNLVSRTDLFQVATLAEEAFCAVGNDTGPMHIAAAAGAKCLVLFSAGSDPNKVSPRGGGGVMTMFAPDLAHMPVEQVDQGLRNFGVYAFA